MKEELSWRVYERIVAAVEVEEHGIDLSVTPNARLTGKISGKSRQIDVLIDARWGDDLSGRIIVDAKLRRRRIDINTVEAFEGMMKDCSAHRGVIVCANGYTDGALKRAQDAITIKLLRADEVDEYAWAAYDPCLGKCARVSDRIGGLVLWDGQHPLPLGPGWAIVFTGKCDVCHEFNVWCWDCGEKFPLSSEDEYTCSCERTWVSAIEEQETDDEAARVHQVAVHLLVTDGDQVLALDRRALR